jgi:hypothetical protein
VPDDLEVMRLLVPLDQEAIVLGIEHGALMVLAGEALDRIERVPERALAGPNRRVPTAPLATGT